MMPVCIYFDGFNFYHALLKFGDNKVKWLDLNSLSKRLISPKTDEIKQIYYFSAYADWRPDKMKRHQEYISALQARNVTCVMGHFKKKDGRCHTCGSSWIAREEKETDVSIGITMLNDAYKGKFEKAYLVTRDSDLMPAVRMIKTEFPAKHIVAVAPPMMGHSNDLISICHSKMKISPKQVYSCLLPKHVLRPDMSLAATRPIEYD